MFQNALKTTLRNLAKHKGYSFLNIAGLSVGLAMFILILLFVGYEFRYEKHHRNADRIYRLIPLDHGVGEHPERAGVGERKAFLVEAALAAGDEGPAPEEETGEILDLGKFVLEGFGERDRR